MIRPIRFSRGTALKGAVLILIIVLVRAALPVAGKAAINWALQNKMQSYTGELDDLDLSLYRGAYQLQGLRIWKKDSDQPPLLSLEDLDLSLAWRALLRGEVTADITGRALVLRLIDSEKEDKRQLGRDEKGWQDVVNSLIPVSIESLRLTGSQIELRNIDLREPVSVRATKIDFEAHNLRNRGTKPGQADSPFKLTAVLQDHAGLRAEGRVNVLAKPPVFEGDVELKDFDMKSVNKVLLAYLPLDITRGKLDLYGEIAGTPAELRGYAKVFLEDADIVAPKQKFRNFRHVIFEIGAAFGNWILKNSKDKTVAARIPFERHGGKFNVDTTEAFWSSIDNARGDLKPGLEKSVHL